MERLQSRAARIVLTDGACICPRKIWLPVLVGTLLRQEERNISSNLSRIVLTDELQVISQKIFDGELRDIHDYDTRSKDRLSIDKVNLELTKRTFFL